MNVEEAIQTAIQYEKRVVQVYEETALASADQTGKKICGALAKEEQQHVAYLESRLSEWKATGHLTAASLGTVVPSRARIEEGLNALEHGVARRRPGERGE